MTAGIIGIATLCFVTLSARAFGYDARHGAARFGLAALAFVISMASPSFGMVEREPGFAIFGAVLAATGAWLLYLGVARMVQGGDAPE